MADNRLIITTVYGRKLLIHLIKDRIERIRVIESESSFPLGTVVIGRVKKMLPSSNACFVNIGNGKDYFLSLPVNLNEIIFTDGKKHENIHPEDEILVQIETEAIKSKQPSLTHRICLTGRYFVIEQGSGLSFSKKIPQQIKKKIYIPEIINDYKNKYRIVVRTEVGELFSQTCSENSPEEEINSGFNPLIEAEAESLIVSMEHIFERCYSAPDYYILYKPGSQLELYSKEWLKYGVEELLTDEKDYFSFFEQISGNAIPVRFYEDEDLPLYKLYKLETAIDSLISKKVFLNSGGFLVVEQGETLTAIDVNTAHAVKGSKEAAVFKTNLEAADEIAHILKNRNLNGMILVDFINMKDSENEKRLISHMKLLLSGDDVRCNFVDMTGLGLMEITRQRRYKTFLEQWKS